MIFYRIGSFPICAQCNETCYENWYRLIEKERTKVDQLSKNVTMVLQTFNGSSVEDINQTLAELNTKLAESETIFNGSRFDTKTKEEKYRAVRTTNDYLKTCSLMCLQQYILYDVRPFNNLLKISLLFCTLSPPPPSTTRNAQPAANVLQGCCLAGQDIKLISGCVCIILTLLDDDKSATCCQQA